MKVAIVFDNFGPYHLTRLRAASGVCRLFAVEINRRSREYAWAPLRDERQFHYVTLNDSPESGSSNSRRQTRELRQALECLAPDCVFIPGWSRRYALQALKWCRQSSIPAVMMSESSQQDAPRVFWKEWLKRRIVAMCSTAFVGGARHADYLVKLGFPQDRIFRGYDAVDNDYFRRGAAAARERGADLRGEFDLPDRYFLASARFTQKKNLPHLVRAYARYRELAARGTGGGPTGQGGWPWSLVILGEGVQRPDLSRLIPELSLDAFVSLPGFRQYPVLPVYYGLAECFVHPSACEPWGLVVNEAMASGLPVLVSDRCGCVPELVDEGRNGFTFDPYNIEQLAELMLRLATHNSQLLPMRAASMEIVSSWGPDRFARGLAAAAQKAIER